MLRLLADIVWERAPERALDTSREPFVTWFPDGRLNTAFNCLDRHVEEGNGDRLALVYDSPVTGTVRRYTYSEAVGETARLAGALR